MRENTTSSAFAFANVFDTMISSRLLGAKELGLAAAISRYFGVTLSKKLQRADWGRRPLTDEQLRYAQMDTHYLIPLSDILKSLLREKKRQDDAVEAFARLAAIQPDFGGSRAVPGTLVVKSRF
jgi:ribonuclease D